MYSLYQQIVSYLQEYKAALTDENVWLAVAGRLGNLLNIVSGKIHYVLAIGSLWHSRKATFIFIGRGRKRGRR